MLFPKTVASLGASRMVRCTVKAGEGFVRPNLYDRIKDVSEIQDPIPNQTVNLALQRGLQPPIIAFRICPGPSNEMVGDQIYRPHHRLSLTLQK
jgi:hypothetical protein